MESPNKISYTAKIIAACIAITFIILGVVYIITAYVPASWGKHGYLPAIYGEDAKVFGSLTIAIGLLPLLLFAKNARQAMFIGTVLGTAIVVGIFIWVYG